MKLLFVILKLSSKSESLTGSMIYNIHHSSFVNAWLFHATYHLKTSLKLSLTIKRCEVTYKPKNIRKIARSWQVSLFYFLEPFILAVVIGGIFLTAIKTVFSVLKHQLTKKIFYRIFERILSKSFSTLLVYKTRKQSYVILTFDLTGQTQSWRHFAN